MLKIFYPLYLEVLIVVLHIEYCKPQEDQDQAHQEHQVFI